MFGLSTELITKGTYRKEIRVLTFPVLLQSGTLIEIPLLTLSLPWEMTYFCKTATEIPYTNCNTPIKRFYLGHCINHSSKDKGSNRKE